MSTEISWAEIEGLLRAQGSTTHAAAQLERLRKANKLSQEQLAQKLARSGEIAVARFDRTAVSKIETGARSLSLGETLAISKVFDIPFASLLLPDGVSEQLEGWRLVAESSRRLNDYRAALLAYFESVRKARQELKKRKRLRPHVDRFLAESESKIRKELISALRRYPESAVTLGVFKMDDPEGVSSVPDEMVWVNASPAMVAARDVLGDEELDDFAWMQTTKVVVKGG